MTKKIKKSVSLLKALTLLLVLFGTVHCSNSQNSKSEVKAPGMDIYTATFMGDLKTVQQHIDAGTNLNQKDAYGSTPLNIAATFGKTEVALALIKGGADLSIKNPEGSTALHTAAFFCRIEIVEALVKAGADKEVKNNYGSTALQACQAPFSAVKPIYEQVAKQLGALGLKIDFEYIEKTRPEIAKLLL